METPQQYIASTRSAVEHLIAGIDSYLQILRNAPAPALIGNYLPEPERNVAIDQWMKDNKEAIQKALDAQRAFVSEKYALSTMCGSLLQIAAMAIRLYSSNKTVPPELAGMVKAGQARYCVGRTVRHLPLGLVIYAGRNLYNHIDDSQLREPSTTVFEWLTTRHDYGSGIRDPSFDLNAGLLWNYPSNVISLTGWNTYPKYEADMHSLLGI